MGRLDLASSKKERKRFKIENMRSLSTSDILTAISGYTFESGVVSCQPLSSGHINDSFDLRTGRGHYLLQRINTEVFANPEALMANIEKVAGYLRVRITERKGNPARETLTLIRAKDGKSFVKCASGYWRAFYFIENAETLMTTDDFSIIEGSGKALGRFQRDLSDFLLGQLRPVIPDFHNTQKRLFAFESAVRDDPLNRVSKADPEITFALSMRHYALAYPNSVPLRVSHNDPKLPNIMFDKATHRVLGLIDFDTVMPGYALDDYGDALRDGASSSAEDEQDLSKVHFDLARFESYNKGYLPEASKILVHDELALLPYSVAKMTYELAIRFLTDYLLGDRYFKIDYPGHNLVRAKCQLALLKDVVGKQKDMAASLRPFLVK